jgi:hypothetical protein
VADLKACRPHTSKRNNLLLSTASQRNGQLSYTNIVLLNVICVQGITNLIRIWF